MFSIIIPTLNEERYISKLLDCLVKQIFKDFEVIVVDGHSDDNTNEIIKSYLGLLDFKLIITEKRNISYQRNLGAENSKYNNLIFIDADTIFSKYLLYAIKEHIKHKNISIAGIKTKLISGNIWDNIFFATINIFFNIVSRLKPYSLGSLIYCKKEIHNKINGFGEVFAENFDYIHNANKLGKFDYITKEFVLTSSRRFQKYGTKRIIKIWLMSFCYHFFTNRNFKVNYPDD